MVATVRNAFLGLLLVGAVAHAQVDCAGPDALCTGDPCVIGSIVVASPCVVDFGPRAVRVDGHLDVVSTQPNATLAFTAGSVEVNGSILARGDFGPGTLVQAITLEADGSIVVAGRIATKRRRGTIRLQAGSDVVLERRGAIVAGGTVGVVSEVILDAGGNVRIERPIRVSGGIDPAIDVVAGGDVDVAAPLRVSAGVTSALVVDAGGTLTVGGAIRLAEPRHRGGTVVLRGAAGVVVDDVVRVTGINGGSVEVSSATGPVSVRRTMSAHGVLEGGAITLSAAGRIDVTAPLTADPGGDVSVVSTAGDVRTAARILASGEASLAKAGTVRIQASGEAAIEADIVVVNTEVTLPHGIRVEAARIVANSGATLNADGAAGELRLGTTSADMALAGSFRAAGGVLEAHAATDLTASGAFRAAPGGCIALSAGGLLDAAGATFDLPVAADCPGS
jgi:hypothetical protein